MKKSLISAVVASSLFLSSANAGGIPTIDVSAIAQQVMSYQQTLKDYAEQIEQYEQMVKDTLNFEKQMQELGVDMNSVYEILGDAQSMISQMQSIYENVKNLPQDIMGDIARVKTACSFLEQNSQFFNHSVKTSSKKMTSRVNQCTMALRDGANISKEIDKLTAKMDKAIDPIERANYQAQISNLKYASEFLQEKENIEKTNNLIAFQDAFYSNDKSNQNSKAKMADDLKTLSKQLSKANNQKQAQALTNSILLKILENMQQQYELNINYTSTMASIRQATNESSFKNLTEDSFNKSVVEYKRNDAILNQKPNSSQKMS
ncbi:type IV secretion system protein [Campylobacter hyointestinalis]|uniref:type IV secretion system protein n=1 Tax=Campylobacter hyointestinalis TaxID=198 RepID=UPI0020239AC9|nr:type IV secretion system protein [Campylobacter hyointestinalis]MDY2999496.1 type IV secretion system protein [Campylobacter hyointestinalis]